MSFVQQAPTSAMPRKAEQTVIPRFFTRQMETDQIDPETGLRVYRTVEYVELLIPGDKSMAPEKRVNEHIKAQFRDAYVAFKEKGEGADMIGDGIPLKLWPGIKSEIAKGLEQINVYTVQQLAALPDQKCSAPGTLGLRGLRDHARAFLDSVKDTAPISALQKQLDDLKQKSELRDAQLQQALDRATELEKRLAEVSGGMAPAEQMPDLTTPRGRKEK